MAITSQNTLHFKSNRRSFVMSNFFLLHVRVFVIFLSFFTFITTCYSYELFTTLSGRNWSGIYVGINGGYGWGNPGVTFQPLPDITQFANLSSVSFSPSVRGGVFGGQMGINWQFQQFIVASLEGDINQSSLHGFNEASPIVQNEGGLISGKLTAQQKTNWFATLRPRIGWLPYDCIMLYATGGWIFGHIIDKANASFLPYTSSSVQYPAAIDKKATGWIIGTGAEWLFTPHWSTKIEYLYFNLGHQSFIGNPEPENPPFQVEYSSQNASQIIRLGVNYKF